MICCWYAEQTYYDQHYSAHKQCLTPSDKVLLCQLVTPACFTFRCIRISIRHMHIWGQR